MRDEGRLLWPLAAVQADVPSRCLTFTVSGSAVQEAVVARVGSLLAGQRRRQTRTHEQPCPDDNITTTSEILSTPSRSASRGVHGVPVGERSDGLRAWRNPNQSAPILARSERPPSAQAASRKDLMAALSSKRDISVSPFSRTGRVCLPCARPTHLHAMDFLEADSHKTTGRE